MSELEIERNKSPRDAKDVKPCRLDTKRGLYIARLFSPEGVSAKNSPLAVTAKGEGKLWSGVTETLGYGYNVKQVVIGTTEETLEDGTVKSVDKTVTTHFGVLPEGMAEPLFTQPKAVKPPKEPKAPKAPKSIKVSKEQDGVVGRAKSVKVVKQNTTTAENTQDTNTNQEELAISVS